MQLLLQQGNKKTETVWHATLARRKLITYALAFIALLFLVLIDVAGYIRSPTPAARDIRVFVDSHLMLSKHVNSVCKSAFFSIRNIGRIGKYLDCDQCFLLYLKLCFMGTDRSLPGPLDFGMYYRQTLRILNHSMFLRVKLEDSCSTSPIEYKDHIIVEYQDYYYHYYYYVQSINNISITLQYSFYCFCAEIYCNFRVPYTA